MQPAILVPIGIAYGTLGDSADDASEIATRQPTARPDGDDINLDLDLDLDLDLMVNQQLDQMDIQNPEKTSPNSSGFFLSAYHTLTRDFLDQGKSL
jgi:hypothetical protein